MVAFARRSTASYSGRDIFDSDESYAFDEPSPGERVCPPHHRSRGGAALRGLIFILIVGGGGWMLVNDRASWPWWVQAAVDYSIGEQWVSGPDGQVVSAMERSRSPVLEEPAVTAARDAPDELEPDGLPSSNARSATAPAAAEPELDVVTLNVPDESGPDELEAAPAPEEVAALPEAASAAGEADAARLPTPAVDPDNPYQRRAAAVGLHPGLSRVLLERMSPVDYRNAGIAIQKALEGSDDAVVVWPRQRKPELALFRVRFVPGAASGCRRYVVTITKSGWTTTALPMENCGSQTAGLPKG